MEIKTSSENFLQDHPNNNQSLDFILENSITSEIRSENLHQSLDVHREELMGWANVLRSNFIKTDNLLTLKHNLASCPLKNLKQIKTLLIDLENKSGHEMTFQMFRDPENNWITGVFNCSYYPQLKFELGKFYEINPTISFPMNFKKRARSIVMINGTTGLLDDTVVALFPENFMHHLVTEEDTIFYFADKFAKRNSNFTFKLLKELNCRDFFNEIFELEFKERMELATNWVHLHENFHRTGPMPIPKFLYEKSTPLTAAIEELRVDLHSMIYCLNNYKSNGDAFYKTFLFILSERLIGYPLFRDLKTNFDAFSSLIFMNELENIEGIKVDNDGFKFCDEIIFLLKLLVRKIEQIETFAVSFENKEERKNFLLRMFQYWHNDSKKQEQIFTNWKGISNESFE